MGRTLVLAFLLSLTALGSGCALFGGGGGAPAPELPVDFGELRLRPAAEQVSVGDPVTVTISQQGGRDLYGLALRATYPNDLLEFVGVEWIPAGTDVFSGHGLAWQHHGIDGKSGYVAIVRSQEGPTVGVDNVRTSGEVVRLRWQARRAGTAEIALDRERLTIANSNGVDVSQDWDVTDVRISIAD